MSVIGAPMPTVEPTQVGDWWMCHGGCGEAWRSPNGLRSRICACTEADAIWQPMRLRERDWLECRNPQALLHMMAVKRGVSTVPDWASLSDSEPSPTTEAEIRCRVGNLFDPFTPTADVLAWRDGTVRAMVSEIAMREAACGHCIAGQVTRWDYERQAEGDKTKTVNCPTCKGTSKILRPRKQIDEHLMPILADALEEAGCTHQHTLTHLRQPGEHAAECHVLRALLDV